MKIRAGLVTPVALSLLVVAGGAAVWWAGTPAHAAGIWRSTVVPISGVVSGAPERVLFWGHARVDSKLAADPDFHRPSLVLTIDLTRVSGVGASTGTTYVISGPEIVQRRLAASHLVDITFPFFPSGTTGISSAQSGVASFALAFNVDTGEVMTATASIATPSFR